jgi:hypothetical protein
MLCIHTRNQQHQPTKQYRDSEYSPEGYFSTFNTLREEKEKRREEKVACYLLRCGRLRPRQYRTPNLDDPAYQADIICNELMYRVFESLIRTKKQVTRYTSCANGSYIIKTR